MISIESQQKTPKVLVINKRVDHSPKTFREMRKTWNYLYTMNGGKEMKILLALKDLNLAVFGKRWSNNFFTV